MVLKQIFDHVKHVFIDKDVIAHALEPGVFITEDITQAYAYVLGIDAPEPAPQAVPKPFTDAMRDALNSSPYEQKMQDFNYFLGIDEPSVTVEDIARRCEEFAEQNKRITSAKGSLDKISGADVYAYYNLLDADPAASSPIPLTGAHHLKGLVW